MRSEISDDSLMRFIRSVFEIVIVFEKLSSCCTIAVHNPKQTFLKYICRFAPKS